MNEPPSKRNKRIIEEYGLKNDHSSDKEVAIVTWAIGKYQWYAPLFIYCIKKAYPRYSPWVVIPEKPVIPQEYMFNIIQLSNVNFPVDGLSVAALRFVYGDELFQKYDFCLITDVDVLIRKEKPNMVNQHLMTMFRDNLECYDNGVFEENRMPGTHFITNKWWPATRDTRKKILEEIVDEKAKVKDWDEKALYRICKDSGLKISKDQRLWSIHGIHLGAYREMSTSPMKDAAQSILFQGLLEDDAFLNILEQCSKNNTDIGHQFNNLTIAMTS